MTYTVYDSNKIMLEIFTSYEQALRYLEENDDIACYINDERLNNNNSIVVDPIPSQPAVPKAVQPSKPKLLSAEQAKQALRDKLSVEVEGIINTVLEMGGQSEYEPGLHPLVISMLIELGYKIEYVDPYTRISIPLED